jgi:MFS family permease
MFDINEKKTIFFTALTHGFTHFYMTAFTATNIIMAAHFGLSLTAIGDIGFVHSFLFGIGSLAAGFLISRLGARKSILLSVGFGIFFSLCVAASPSPLFLAIFLGALGFSGSIYHASGLTLVTNNVNSRGRGLAWHGIGGTLGFAVSPMITGFITQYLGWRWAYVIIAVPGVLILLFGIFSKIDENAIAGDTLQRNIKNGSNKKKFSHPVIFLAIVFSLQICFGLFFNGTTIFLPAYAAKSINLPALGLQGIALGGFYTTVSLLGGLGGQFLGGEASERFKLYRLQFFVMLFTVPAIFMMGITTNYLLILAMVLFSVFGFSWQPIGNGLVAYYAPPKWRGYAYSISSALSFGVGAFASSIAGRIADHHGLDRVFIVMAGIGLIAFLFSIPLWILNKRAEKG